MSESKSDRDPRRPDFELAVRERDHHQCQKCHRHESEIGMEIFQIVPDSSPELILSNHILLCEDHYKEAVNNRRRLN